jgi:hypothetical protein
MNITGRLTERLLRVAVKNNTDWLPGQASRIGHAACCRRESSTLQDGTETEEDARVPTDLASGDITQV